MGDSERSGSVWRAQGLVTKAPHVTLDAYGIAHAVGATKAGLCRLAVG